ncbi:hypothetical protein [Chitinimonas naiadis]
MLVLAAPALAEQTVCYAHESNFMAECGVCPPGSDWVSGPSKAVDGCTVRPHQDPRLITQEEGLARIAGRYGKRKPIAGWTGAGSEQALQPAMPAPVFRVTPTKQATPAEAPQNGRRISVRQLSN